MKKVFNGVVIAGLVFGLLGIFSCATGGANAAGGESKDSGEAKTKSSSSSKASGRDAGNSPLFGTKWMLTEAAGKPLSEFGELTKEPFIILDGEEMRLSGNAGCNNLMSSFTLEGENRIYFAPVASTLMACPNMELEEEFKRLLETADTYILSGDELVLTKARMAPLLRFVSSDVYQARAAAPAGVGRWEGVYTGVLPCADCEGIQTELRLRSDGTYVLRRIYLGKSSEVFLESGRAGLDSSANVLTLTPDGSGSAPLSVEPGDFSVTVLDQQGRKISGNLGANYVLRKEIPPVLETYWKLTELYGETVRWSGEGSREPHMILRTTDSRVNGSGGTNSFTGTYTLSEGDLRFSQVAATQMAGPDMNTERLFFRALGETQSYEARNGKLSLYNASGDTLARFEAVYLR